MSSTFTTNINLEEPALGDYVNSWNTPVNSNFTVMDAVFGSSTSVAFTNANVTLTVAQAAYFQIVCTGTLTANVQLILPSAIGGRRVIYNQCTGAFTLTVLNGSGDTGGGVVVGQGFQTPIVLTAGRAFYDAYASTPPGTIQPTSFNSAMPGFLLCFGQTISRTTYAQLWAAAQAYGWSWGNGDGSTTFSLPDLRGRLLAGADNMGGSAAGRLSGYTVGTAGGTQNVSIAQNQLPNIAPTFTATNDYAPGTILSNEPNIITGSTAPNVTGGSGIFAFVSQPASGHSSVTLPSYLPTGNISSINGNVSQQNLAIVQPTAAINYMIRY